MVEVNEIAPSPPTPLEEAGATVAHVMTGGDVPSGTWVDEQHILDLEREGFLSLLGEPMTMARIQHFLTTGKVLRN